MSKNLDLHDIQGNVIKAYGRLGFPKSRYVFFRFLDGCKGRQVIANLAPLVTNSVPWDENRSPDSTLNIALTYEGLKHLEVPEASLHSFPTEFSMGMKARREIVGDVGVNDPLGWDPIWNTDSAEQPVHMILWFNGRSVEAIEKVYQRILAMLDGIQGAIQQLVGHRGDDDRYQEASVLLKNGKPSAREHFGYRDGISEPFFEGCGNDASRVIGGGKPTGANPKSIEGWAPLATGEFILGHKDEAFEYPQAPIPAVLAKNGTFMVFRKLHQNVATFRSYIKEMSAQFPGDDAEATISAKFIGRWKNGAPLATFPTKAASDKFDKDMSAARKKANDSPNDELAQAQYIKLRAELVAFDYRDDISGARCPIGSHIRRANPRGALEFGQKGAYDTPGALVNRRRIIRRGLPYGEAKDESSDNENHGIIFMALNASIKRQFEFVQQQWMNFGNDFKLGNDQDPVLGNRDLNGFDGGRMTFQADPNGNDPPFVCGKMPTFVETRGGDYFFVPSLTALRMIGDGIIDPT